MRKNDEEYDFMEEAFRERPAAPSRQPVAKGDESNWLDDAFSDQAPVRRKMSGKAKAAIAVAIVAVLVLLVLLGVESMNALGAFFDVAASN